MIYDRTQAGVGFSVDWELTDRGEGAAAERGEDGAVLPSAAVSPLSARDRRRGGDRG
jgi:hypothetical protein